MSTNTSKEKVARGRQFTQHGTKVYNGEDYMNLCIKNKTQILITKINKILVELISQLSAKKQ